MRKILLIISILIASCSEQPYHSAASDDLHEQIMNAMRSTYQALGQDPSIVNTKKHRSLAYQLALHVKTEGDKLEHITSGKDTEANVRHYARSSITLVQQQRPGYPVVPMFDALFGLETLSTDQQILLLACTAKLLAESEIVIHKPGVHQ